MLSSREVADRLGISRVLLRHRIGSDEWDRVPPPSGRANQKHYWKLDRLEAWEAKNPPEARPRFRHHKAVKRRRSQVGSPGDLSWDAGARTSAGVGP